MIEGEEDEADFVFVVDPTHPLRAAADRPADTHFERREHFRQCAAVLVEDYAGSQ